MQLFRESAARIGAIDHEGRLHDYAEYKKHGAKLLKHFLRRRKKGTNMQMDFCEAHARLPQQLIASKSARKPLRKPFSRRPMLGLFTSRGRYDSLGHYGQEENKIIMHYKGSFDILKCVSHLPRIRPQKLRGFPQFLSKSR